MDQVDLSEKFKKITLWKRDGERAPHKPLLVLYALGRLQRNENRLIPYEEVDSAIQRLFKEFGPNRNIRPEYPFFRLQKDGIWELQNAEKLSLTSSGDAKKTELIRYHISGGFRENVFNDLRQNQKLFQNIVQEILTANFPPSIHEDVLQSAGIDFAFSEATPKKRNPEFREKILRAYEYSCAVCGFDVRLDLTPIALEAAHIKWHNAGGPDIEINGIALCTLHHKLFDRGAFTFTEHLEIMVSDRANGSRGFTEWLLRFHGEKMRVPQRESYLPDQKFRQWHIREVFQGEFREKSANKIYTSENQSLIIQ